MWDLGVLGEAGGDSAEPDGAHRPLRLLHVFPQFNTGGAQVRLARLAGALGDGFSHTILSLSGDYSAAGLMPPQAEVHYLGPPPKGPLPRRLLQYWRTLNEVRPDLFLTYNWGAIEFALLARFAASPHLHHEDGFGPEEAARQLRRRVWFRRIALPRSHLLVPSKGLEKTAVEMWRLNPDRVHYVANGVPPAAPPRSDLRELDLDPHLARIAWIGGLRPEKNLPRLLQAFAPLRDLAVLLVIGDGPERGALVETVRSMNLGDRVRLLGARADARDVLQQCDLLALSSDTEQMPLVVLEAMEAGLPVAAVDVGDVRRMVSEESRPYVTPPRVRDLSQALRALVADPELRRRVGEANRHRVAAVYSHQAMVANHRDLIVRLAGARQR